jgi:hypothetical protein
MPFALSLGGRNWNENSGGSFLGTAHLLETTTQAGPLHSFRCEFASMPGMFPGREEFVFLSRELPFDLDHWRTSQQNCF